MDDEPAATVDGWCIRAWRDDDGAALLDLLDDAPDELWLERFYAPHSADRGPWR